MTMRPKASSARAGFFSTVRSALSPDRPKNTGMNSATMRPRSCSSIWRVRIGDSPIRMPATKAPSTVLTPISCVISAIAIMITRMMVMTGNSLWKLSLAQRIRLNTMRRPKVRLTAMNAAVPSTARPSDQRSTVPAEARPSATAMMTQPMVSSKIAEATMIWPRSRRMKFISRTTIATIFTDEIDSAVPRKIAVTRRASGFGNSASGSISPSAKPQTNGSATPAAATVTAARPTRFTSCRSVSMPVSSSSIKMPSCDTALIMLFCSGVPGTTRAARRARSGRAPTVRAKARR